METDRLLMTSYYCRLMYYEYDNSATIAQAETYIAEKSKRDRRGRSWIYQIVEVCTCACARSWGGARRRATEATKRSGKIYDVGSI